MPEEFVSKRAFRAASEARQGADWGLPSISVEEKEMKTEHLRDFWGKRGFIRKEYYVHGLAGESRNMLAGPKVPVGALRLESGDLALFSIHPDVNSGTLRVVIHGFIPKGEFNPGIREHVQKYQFITSIAGSPLEQKGEVRHTVISHRVLLDRDLSRAVADMVKDMVARDLASVVKQEMSPHVLKAIERASEEYSKIFDGVVKDEARSGRKEAQREKKQNSFEMLQQILARSESKDIVENNPFEAVRAVVSFQRELAAAVESLDMPEHLRRWYRSVVETEDLNNWNARYRLLDLALRYHKLLKNAAKKGSLNVEIIHRVG